MRHPIFLTLSLLAVAAPAAGQSRAVNLTGRPLATLDEPFSGIGGLAELPGGKVVVHDQLETRLVMVDFARGTVADIGRQGGGPGEWRQPISVLRGAANQVIVGDPGLSKLHLITPDGKITGAILPPTDDARNAVSMAMARGADSRGRIYFQALPDFSGGSVPDSANIMRYDPSLKRTDLMSPIPTGMTGSVRGGEGNMTVSMRQKPMSGADAWVALPDGRVAIVRANPYRVDIVTGPGQVRRGTPVPFTPVRVGKAERDAYRTRAATARPMMISVGGGGGGGTPPPGARSVGGGANAQNIPDEEFPAVMPPFGGRGTVVATPEGEIWVLRNRAASDPTPTYDIFSGEGQLVGKATLKPNSIVVGFGAGVAYVARQDPEDDLRYLEKYAR